MFEYVTLFSVPFVRNAFVYQILHEKEIRSTYEINKFSVENSLNDFYSFVDARSFSNTSTRHISYILTLHVVFGCTGANVGLTNRAF